MRKQILILHIKRKDTCDEIPKEIDFKEQDDLSTKMLLKHALYAEEASDVSIRFTDIVGFSAMSMKVDSILIIDILHDLFHRFDMISKKKKNMEYSS